MLKKLGQSLEGIPKNIISGGIYEGISDRISKQIIEGISGAKDEFLKE